MLLNYANLDLKGDQGNLLLILNFSVKPHALAQG